MSRRIWKSTDGDAQVTVADDGSMKLHVDSPGERAVSTTLSPVDQATLVAALSNFSNATIGG